MAIADDRIIARELWGMLGNGKDVEPGGRGPRDSPRLGYIPPGPFLPKTVLSKRDTHGFILRCIRTGKVDFGDGLGVVSLQRFFWPTVHRMSLDPELSF